MTKRILFFALMVAMVVTLLVPLGASAFILDASVNWYGQSFEGSDPFYGNRNVVAFLEGSTATVQFGYLNDTGSDITVKPFVQFDWGGRYYGAERTMAAGEATTLGIQFAAPAAATAGLVEHGYYLSVEYRANSGSDYSGPSATGETYSAAPGWTTRFLNNSPVVAASLRVWRSIDAGVSWEEMAGTMYTLNVWTGLFTLNAATTVATEFRFNYEYYEDLGQGNAVDKVFSVSYHPPSYGQVVDGTLAVYVTDQYLNTVTQVASGWTFDAMSGEITFATAPTYNQHILARYEYWDTIADRYNSSDPPNITFVVYSQAQADAQTARMSVNELWDSIDYLYAWQVDDGNPSLGSWWSYDSLLGSATNNAVALGEKLDDEAYELYVAGDFAGALAKWTEAETAFNNAITSQQTLIGGVEESVTGLISGAGSWLDAQGTLAQAQADSATSQSDAQAKKLKAEATKAKSYGTFLILMGVFLVIVAVALLLLAIGKFLLWRSPAHHEHT